MLYLPRRRDDQPIRSVFRAQEGDQLAAIDTLDALLEARDRPPDRRVAPDEPVDQFADDLIGDVVNAPNFLSDDFALFLDIIGAEERAAQHVRDDIEADLDGVIGDSDGIGGRLAAGARVDVAANPLDLLGDDAGVRAALRPLEEHMLDEVRDARLLIHLVARADAIIEMQSRGAHMHHAARDDAHAVREGRFPVHRVAAQWSSSR
jgi:hypothetical protein